MEANLEILHASILVPKDHHHIGIDTVDMQLQLRVPQDP